MNSRKVLLAAPVHPVLTEGLEADGYELLTPLSGMPEQTASILESCTGVITSTRLVLNQKLLDAAPQLRWIGRMGSGMELIDLPYAASKGIDCFSSPEGNCNAVGEHALGMLLSLNKRICVSRQEVINGQWRREENRGTELEGKTIGIIGFGHTGRAFAHKLLGMDMRILAYDKAAMRELPESVHLCRYLDDIQEQAEIISFHVPIAPDTHHYFNDQFLIKMRQPFVLVNTSRGEVIDNEALLNGIRSGKMSGACLDVWEEEPLEQMSPRQREILEELAGLSQVIITPHIAGYSHEALYKMSLALLHKIRHIKV